MRLYNRKIDLVGPRRRVVSQLGALSTQRLWWKEGPCHRSFEFCNDHESSSYIQESWLIQPLLYCILCVSIKFHQVLSCNLKVGLCPEDSLSLSGRLASTQDQLNRWVKYPGFWKSTWKAGKYMSKISVVWNQLNRVDLGVGPYYTQEVSSYWFAFLGKQVSFIIAQR